MWHQNKTEVNKAKIEQMKSERMLRSTCKKHQFLVHCMHIQKQSIISKQCKNFFSQENRTVLKTQPKFRFVNNFQLHTYTNSYSQQIEHAHTLYNWSNRRNKIKKRPEKIVVFSIASQFLFFSIQSLGLQNAY